MLKNVVVLNSNGKIEKLCVDVEEEQSPSPAELRENAYNTKAIIAWDGEMLTVTQASQKWQYYAAEGNIAKTDELTALIAEAKSSIREQFPDEEGNTQALMGQKNI